MNWEAPKRVFGGSRLPAPVETIKTVVGEVFLFTFMFSMVVVDNGSFFAKVA